MDEVRDPWFEVSAVRMRPGAVAGIGADVLSGAGIGGLLLGSFHMGDRKFRVEDYRPGPPAEGARSGIIGLYRSHNRTGLQTNENDAALVRRFFPSGPSVLLLVKPLSAQKCVAAFFRCADGTILEPGTSSEEFPFRIALSTAARGEPAKRRGADRWLIPSAIAVGLAAALFMHYNSDQPDENPVAGASVVAAGSHSINSSSDAAQPKPLGRSAASAPAGVPERAGSVRRFVDEVTTKASHLWPAHSAKQQPQTP